MRNITCIVCPIGCGIEIESGDENNLMITGNKCQRGAVYAQEEIRSPKRVVTATASLNEVNCSVRRVPVKTSVPCLREKIPELLNDIYMIKVSLPVKIGDALITNWKNQGIDVVATRSIE